MALAEKMRRRWRTGAAELSAVAVRGRRLGSGRRGGRRHPGRGRGAAALGEEVGGVPADDGGGPRGEGAGRLKRASVVSIPAGGYLKCPPTLWFARI
jgi:hypothetical protein